MAADLSNEELARAISESGAVGGLADIWHVRIGRAAIAADRALNASKADALPVLPEADGIAEVDVTPEPEGGYSCNYGPAWSERFVRAYGEACAAQERERCARTCEAMAEDARAEMLRQPEGSPARDRYFARREALVGAAVELRLGPLDGTTAGPLGKEYAHA